MANFPTSLDSFTDPASSDPMNNPDQATLFTELNAALEAVETKVGTGSSTSTANTVLTGNGSGTSAWAKQITVEGNARAYKSAAQDNLTDNTWTQVQLDAENYDTGSDFDSTTNYRFTAPITGYYLICAQVQFSNMVADRPYTASLTKNGLTGGGGTQLASNSLHTSNTVEAMAVPVSTVVQLTAADTVQLDCKANAGVSTVDIQTGSQYTFMSIILLSL